MLPRSADFCSLSSSAYYSHHRILLANKLLKKPQPCLHTKNQIFFDLIHPNLHAAQTTANNSWKEMITKQSFNILLIPDCSTESSCLVVNPARPPGGRHCQPRTVTNHHLNSAWQFREMRKARNGEGRGVVVHFKDFSTVPRTI